MKLNLLALVSRKYEKINFDYVLLNQYFIIFLACIKVVNSLIWEELT